MAPNLSFFSAVDFSCPSLVVLMSLSHLGFFTMINSYKLHGFASRGALALSSSREATTIYSKIQNIQGMQEGCYILPPLKITPSSVSLFFHQFLLPSCRIFLFSSFSLWSLWSFCVFSIRLRSRPAVFPATSSGLAQLSSVYHLQNIIPINMRHRSLLYCNDLQFMGH